MKIIYDFRIFSLQRHGGISRYFSEIAKHLSKFPGIELSIVAPLFVNQYLKEANASFVHGIFLPKSPRFLSKFIEIINTIISTVYLYWNKPDILHETYYSNRTIAPRGTKVVLTVYDMIHEKFPEFYPGDPTAKLKAMAVANADHIICISEFTKSDLISFLHVDPSKISVTLLASDFSTRADEVSPTSPYSFTYVLFVGPRSAHKNFRQLVKAFSISEKLKTNFKIVSFGSSKFSNEEIESALKLGLTPEHFFHAGNNDKILPNLYAHAAVFVYPSLYEGFGIPPLEAMALSCPVACSNAASIPEVVGDAAVYFDPNNAEEIKSAIESIVLFPAKRSELILLGKERCKNFTWIVCSEKTKKIYESLL